MSFKCQSVWQVIKVVDDTYIKKVKQSINFCSDIKCGRLHCIHENEKLAFGDPSTVYTSYTGLRLRNGEDLACRVVWTKYVSGHRETDPGMVPNGAFCGQNEVILSLSS